MLGLGFRSMHEYMTYIRSMAIGCRSWLPCNGVWWCLCVTVRARPLVLGVEAIAPVQLGQHLLCLAHRLERAARRLGVGAAGRVTVSATDLVGLYDKQSSLRN